MVHVGASSVGWDQRATRAPAHHWQPFHRWAGAADPPLVSPYNAVVSESVINAQYGYSGPLHVHDRWNWWRKQVATATLNALVRAAGDFLHFPDHPSSFFIHPCRFSGLRAQWAVLKRRAAWSGWVRSVQSGVLSVILEFASAKRV